MILITGIIIIFMIATAEFVEYSSMKVTHAAEFPLYSDQLFYLYFSSRLGEFPIFSVLIFIIRDGLKILEKSYFYPGFFYELEYPFLGNYLQLLVVTVHTNHSISVRAQFNDVSNWHQFEVRYGEFVSRYKMNFAKENFWLYTSVLYSRTVQLLIRTKLDLNTLTKDGRTDGVMVQDPGYLICRGSGGYPKHRVQLIPGYRHHVIKEEYHDILNEHKMMVLFNLRDHGSQFECRTTDSYATGFVNVFHHPTKMSLLPSYHNSMPNGSSVQCIADDGYPPPKVSWTFIQGPVHHDLYFNLYHHQLSLLPNTPIGSQWIFKCISNNTIPPSKSSSTFRLFEFTVVQSSYGTLVVVASSAGVVVILVVIILVLVAIFCQRKSRRRYLMPTEGPPLPPMSERDLEYDPDTACSVKWSPSCEWGSNDAPRYEDVSNGPGDGGGLLVGPSITSEDKAPSSNTRSISYV